MTAPKDDGRSVDARAEALVAAWLEEIEAAGEQELAALRSAHPDRADAIDRAIAARRSGLEASQSGRGDASVDGPLERIGRYQPLSELGRGGQGLVYLAEDTHLGRVVALKILKGFGALSETLMERFKREAEVTSKLDHPGICRVYEAGVTGGVPFIAMQYVRGTTLAETIRTFRHSADPEPSIESYIDFEDEGVLDAIGDDAPSSSATTSRADMTTVIRIVEQAARALHVAHEAGVVHRDIKPGNIIVTPAGEPVLLDFGLAGEEADELALTQTGDVFGTPAYMSPEQLAAKELRPDRRSDVFSLAVTLFECVALARPFEAPTRQGLYRAILHDAPADIRKLNRRVPPDLKVVLDKALEKDRDARYPTALAFAEDLARIREMRPIEARRVSGAGRAWRWAKRQPVRAGLVAALVVGVPVLTSLTGYAIAKQPEIARAERQRTADAVEALLETGFGELWHGDHAVAHDAFERALALDARSAEAIAGKALAQIYRGDRTLALATLDAAPPDLHADGLFEEIRARAVDDPGPRTAPTAAPRSALAMFLQTIPLLADCEEQRDPTVFDRAIDGLRRTIRMAPHARRLYHLQLLHALQHALALAPADAVEHYAGIASAAAAGAIALWPDSAETHVVVGRALLTAEPAYAGRALERALAIDPEHVEAHAYAGRLMIERGEVDAGAASIRRSLAIRKEDVAYIWLAKALADEGDLDGALRTIREALGTWPDKPRLLFELGNVHYRRGEVDDALAAYRKVVAGAPDMAQAHANLGSVLAERGESREATVALRRAIELDPRADQPYYNLAQLQFKAGELADARRNYERAIAIAPDAAPACAGLAGVLHRLGRYAEALAMHRRAIELDPAGAANHANFALTLNELGQYAEALGVVDRSLRLDPNLSGGHAARAQILANLGRVDDGIAAAEKAVALDPDDPNARFALGFVLVEAKRFEEGIDAYQVARERRPRDARIVQNVAYALHELGRFDDAVDEYRLALQLEPTLARAHNGLGISFDALGRTDDALRAYRDAVEHAPDVADYRVNLGRVLATKRKYGEALRVLERAVELDPAHGFGHYWLGRSLRGLRRFVPARAAFEKAAACRPDDAHAQFHYGLALIQTGLRVPAAPLFARAAVLQPSFVDAHQNHAQVLLELDRNAEAVRAARGFAAVAPSPRADWLLGSALVADGKIDDGVATLRAGIERAPHPMLTHTLAGVLCDFLGDWDGAIDGLRATIRAIPNNPSFRAQLGDMCRNDGRLDDAIAAYERAVEMQALAATKRSLAQTRALVALVDRLDGLLAGDEAPADIDEAHRVVERAFLDERFGAASRFALRAIPAADVAGFDDPHLFDVMRVVTALARAGAGEGKDADAFDDDVRQRWHGEAVARLRRVVASFEKSIPDAFPARQQAIYFLRWAAGCPGLRAIRDDDALATRSDEERRACAALWSAVDALRAEIRKGIR